MRRLRNPLFKVFIEFEFSTIALSLVPLREWLRGIGVGEDYVEDVATKLEDALYSTVESLKDEKRKPSLETLVNHGKIPLRLATIISNELSRSGML